MLRGAALPCIVLALMLATLIGACERPYYSSAPPPPVYYYVTPTTTFLRTCPSYGEECPILVQVFGGERVELLDRNGFGWSRVRLERTGNVGWILSDLLSFAPLPVTYYVAYQNVYLRECGDYNCRALELLLRGDRVEKLDQDTRGWWRVTSLKTRTIGWIPASALSPRPGPPFYYVNVSSLVLRAGPSTGNKALATLNFNKQVEMLGMGPTGWAQVRDTRTGLIGWVAARYLEAYPVPYPKTAPKKKSPAKKGAPGEEGAFAPPKAM
jgi:uncharacterized protein YgiM (DUF1202 family)